MTKKRTKRKFKTGDKVIPRFPNDWVAGWRNEIFTVKAFDTQNRWYIVKGKNGMTGAEEHDIIFAKSGIAKLFLFFMLIAGTAFAQECEMDSVLACRDVPKEMRAVIIAQAKLETGNFTSKLYKEHCNAFGMRHPVIRPTRSRSGVARAEGRKGYASYGSLAESVEDMVLYLKYFEVHTQPPKKYVRQLKSVGYFGSSERSYFNGISVHIKSSVCSNVLQ